MCVCVCECVCVCVNVDIDSHSFLISEAAFESISYFSQPRSLLENFGGSMPVPPLAIAVLGLSMVYTVELNWSWDFRGGSVQINWRLKRRWEEEF